MKRDVVILVAILAGAWAQVASADGVRYLGRGSTPDAAVIVDESNRPRELRKGEAVAGIGELSEIDDEEIAFDRAVSDDERKQLRAKGLVAPDVVRVRIARPPHIDSFVGEESAFAAGGVMPSPPSPDPRSP